MAQRMPTRWLVDAGFPHRFLNRFLDAAPIRVMPLPDSRAWVSTDALGSEHVLPSPIGRSVRVLPTQRVRQIQRATSQNAVPFPFGAPAREMPLERHDEFINATLHGYAAFTLHRGSSRSDLNRRRNSRVAGP